MDPGPLILLALLHHVQAHFLRAACKPTFSLLYPASRFISSTYCALPSLAGSFCLHFFLLLIAHKLSVAILLHFFFIFEYGAFAQDEPGFELAESRGGLVFCWVLGR
jgi:hypothetical protein